MTRLEGESYRGSEAVAPWQARSITDELGVPLPIPELRRRSVAEIVEAEWKAIWAACRAFEWVALGYLALSSAMIVMFAENLAHPVRLVGTQALVAVIILCLCRMEARSAGVSTIISKRDGVGVDTGPSRLRANKSACATGGFWHFWRYWYPHLFFLFCFEELGQLVHLVYPGWYDAEVIAFDVWLTGVNPPLWLERLAHPALNEFMQFAYFTYFVFLLILGGILYYRRETEAYWAVMTYSAVGYGLGYVVAMVFPVQSPWFTLAGMWHGELAGGPFTALINFIEKCGRVHGAAFPSQHVAGATAALWGAWRHRRWLFWVFLPFVVCMCVSTVYVRNHYVADVLGGLMTGTLGYVIGKWVTERRRGAAGVLQVTSCENNCAE